MTNKDQRKFLHDFQVNFNLLRAGKINGIQLRLGEKPGQTVAYAKGRVK